MKKNSRFVHLLMLTLCFIATAEAMAQYAWLDEKGNKQFSDQPPPVSVPNNKILKFSGQTFNAQDSTSNTETSKITESRAEKELAYQKRREEQDKKNQQVEALAKSNAIKNDNCNRMRQYQQTLASGQRVQQTDSSGNRSYLSDDKRAEELNRLNQPLDECNN